MVDLITSSSSEFLSATALLVALFLFRMSHKIEKRVLEIAEEKRKDELSENKSAGLTAWFKTENKMAIAKTGPPEAKKIAIDFDKIPSGKRPAWPGGKVDFPSNLGPTSSITRLIENGFGKKAIKT